MSIFKKNKSEDFRANIKVSRTLEGTVFEVVCAVIMIAMWGMALTQPSERIMDWLIEGLVGTVITVVELITVYKPDYINMPFPITNVAQVALTIRMVRVMAVEIALYFAATNPLIVSGDRATAVMLIAPIALTVALIVTFAVFGPMIWKLRTR